MKVVGNPNQKGGVGKTTSAVNMAAVLSKLGKRVLLIDSDPQGNASTSCGVRSEDTLYNVYCGDTIDSVSHWTEFGFEVVPANSDLAAVESEVQQNEILKNALKEIDGQYDYVLLDLPPSLGRLTINGLTACTDVLIPIQGEVLAFHGAQELMDTIQRVQAELNPSLHVLGAFLTMYNDRFTVAREVRRAAKEYFESFGIELLYTKIGRSVRFAEAPAIGTPAVLVDDSNAVQAYERLTKEAFGL